MTRSEAVARTVAGQADERSDHNEVGRPSGPARRPSQILTPRSICVHLTREGE